ncbi:hypothetical protein BS636_13350 [Acinetobacter sp. LoGeW2-3]|uniref:DsrH/TusB family sulfur metabolism protein n=1 Tax=Acinetobacter sp. LoGeW2-3 TaxID=1808001 RepID=UPI000C05A348|nr:DsrH/TusB family sulfur metabolism protein [Acinetobacter sp. LoGeW2-3]ATO20585.1 hypothetical protein BS636_13350 [Acinetobacter sp. LoGeW2-3]
MSDKTLYMIQANYAATAQILEQLSQLYTENDQVILMGDAILSVEHPFIQQLQEIYILENEAELLLQPEIENLKIINYAEFAELCLSFSRCISMK